MIEKFKEVKDYRWLKRYLTFIKKFDGLREVYHNHHILPKSLYVEFSNLNEYAWNLSKLGYREHLIAHYMLAKALGGNMWFAYNNMNAHGVRLKSILYESAMINLSKVHSIASSGMVTCKDKHGNTFRVSKEIFDERDDLVGSTKGIFIGDKNVSKRTDVKNKISDSLSGRIHVIDKEGVRKFIKQESLTDEYTFVDFKGKNAGFTSVKTEYGIKRITTEEYLNGEYEHVNKGRKHSEEFKSLISLKLTGIKKMCTDNYKKRRELFNNLDVSVGVFLGDKELKDFCDNNFISHSRLKKFKNQKVPDINTTQIINYEKVKNTNGWKLIIID